MKNQALLLIIALATSLLSYSQDELDGKEMADAIENEYIFDHAIDVNKIDVSVRDGIVELTGTVNNIKAKERAERIAELVKGVRAVSNRIEVSPPVVLSDDGIKSKVENALLMDPATDSYEVDVKVKDKVVTLEGNVDSYQEKMLCGNVAKTVKGVTGLENNLNIVYQQNRTDLEIKSEIEKVLKWDALIEDGLIDVAVQNGKVELTGTVGSASEKSNAYTSAWVAGVKSVDNTGLEVKWWADDKDLRQNKFTSKSDEEIEEAIKDAALYDPRIYAFNITPVVSNGWVTLRGDVTNLKAKKAAEHLAENTTGVRGVVNRIKVEPQSPPTDMEIAKNVQYELNNNSITDKWQVNVTVDNGIVTLSGTVDSYLEKMEAEWEASGVNGVTEVNNILTVNYPYSYYWYGYYPYYEIYLTPPDPTAMPTVDYPDDDKLKSDIERELWWSPFVDSDQVDVSVNNGHVILEGTVNSWRESEKAVENAWEGGAWSISNELVVK